MKLLPDRIKVKVAVTKPNQRLTLRLKREFYANTWHISYVSRKYGTIFETNDYYTRRAIYKMRRWMLTKGFLKEAKDDTTSKEI